MTAREQALQRWWSWWGAYQRQLDRDELLEAKHLKDAYIAGWLAGGSHALKASAELAGLVPVLRRLPAWRALALRPVAHWAVPVSRRPQVTKKGELLS